MNATTPLPVPQQRRDLPKELPLVHEVQLRTAMAIQHLETSLTGRFDTAAQAASELKSSAGSLLAELKASRDAFQAEIRAEAERHTAALATLGRGLTVLAASVNRLAPGAAPVPEPGACCDVFSRLFDAVEAVVEHARSAEEAQAMLGRLVPSLLPFAEARPYVELMQDNASVLRAGVETFPSGSFVPQGGGWRRGALDYLSGLRARALEFCGALALGQTSISPQQTTAAPQGTGTTA